MEDLRKDFNLVFFQACYTYSVELQMSDKFWIVAKKNSAVMHGAQKMQ